MVKEKVLIISDSWNAPTGFSNSGGNIAWMLADKYEVHGLGLQTFQDHKIDLINHGEKRTVFQHANQPRGNDRWDFGQRCLPRLLDELEPEILLTVNDIQMISHVPDIMCRNQIKLQVMDLPSKQFLSEEALRMQLHGELQKFKEKFPRVTRWLAYSPQDGHPPMPQWEYIYKMADQVVAFCNYGQWVFKQWFGMNVPRIYHGVDTDTFKPMGKPKELQDKFVVGNIGRNQPRKQPVRSMMAFAQFAKDKRDTLLHMQMDWNDEFGWPIEYFGQLYGIMNKMIPPNRVGMPTPEVVKTYNMWDLSLNATGGDGFCIPVIESFACGVPTVGVPYTTFQELIIDGEPTPRGSLAKIKDLHWQKMDVAAVMRSLVDVDDLSNVMNKYYFNRDLIKEHGKNGRTWVEKNCALKILQHQWKDLVGKVLSGEKVEQLEIR